MDTVSHGRDDDGHRRSFDLASVEGHCLIFYFRSRTGFQCRTHCSVPSPGPFCETGVPGRKTAEKVYVHSGIPWPRTFQGLWLGAGSRRPPV